MLLFLIPLELGLRGLGSRRPRRCMSMSRRWCRRRRTVRRSSSRHARRLRARSTACKRHQGDVSRTLDSYAQPTLVPSAHASHPARKNLAALLHELRQDVRALVVDEVHLLDAKLADFLFPEVLAFPAGTPSRAPRTAWSTWPAASRTPFTPPARVTAAVPAFAPRSSAWRWCLFLFLCHTFHPFSFRPGPAGVHSLVNLLKPSSRFLESQSFLAAALARCRSLLRRGRWSSRRRSGPARTPRCALLALLR